MSSNALPKIGIDCRFAGTRSGIGRYTEELVRSLLKRNDHWRYILFVRNRNDLPDLPPSDNFQFSIFNFPFYSLQEQLNFPSLIRQSKIDLLHVPHFNVPFFCPACPAKRGARSRVPFVVTIHDLILHRYPNQASLIKRLTYRILMNHAIKKSSHIFAVSAFTSEEIKKTYGDDLKKKMTVTHEGVSDGFRPASEDQKNQIRKKYDLPARTTVRSGGPSSFLLYTGACKEHKNVQTLIDTTPEDQTLLLVTGGKEIQKLRLKPNVRILTNIPDTDLPILMSAASVYVQPSLYEGFGLPVLEAMACGTSVVASNRTSLPEIAGSHAILVEPTEEGLRRGINTALTLPHDQPDDMAHARSFSWEKMAEKTAEQYSRTLHG